MGVVISWKSRRTVSVTIPAFLGVRSSRETIVVPGGTSPTFTMLPTTSCVEAWILKSAKNASAWMVTPWAVAAVGFIMVKPTVKVVFIFTDGG